MSSYWIGCSFLLLMITWASAIDEAFIMGTSFNAPITPTETQKVEQAKESLVELDELLTNISALLDPIEELMNSTFPYNIDHGTGGMDSIDLSETGETGTGGESTDGSESGGNDGNTGSSADTGPGNESEAGDTLEEEVDICLQEGVFTGAGTRFSSRNYVGFVRDDADDISGLCASHIHPGILYFANDGYRGDNTVYAVDYKNNMNVTSMITLSVENGDWEDIACAPCADGTGDYCIYISETGKIDYEQMNVVYKIREPADIYQDYDYTLSDIQTISYTVGDYDVDNVQALMVTPTGRMFALERSRSYKMYEIIDGQPLVEFCTVALESDEKGPLAGDIDAKGEQWLFKMEDYVYNFNVGDEENIASVLSNPNERIQLDYHEEYYGTSIAWCPTAATYFTVSEGWNEPFYQYFRLE